MAIRDLKNAKRMKAKFERMLRENEPKIAEAVNEWFDLTYEEMRLSLGRMEGTDAYSMTDRLVDWDMIMEEGNLILRKPLLDILAVGGKSIVERRIQKQDRFDIIGVEAIQWATEHSAELVVEITTQTMKGIREFITAGVNAGKSIQTIAKELRGIVGLTERMAMWVVDFQDKLMFDPEFAGLSALQRKAMIDKYAKKLHRYRTDMIARTETADALNEGIRQGFKQIGIGELMRVEDGDSPDEPCRVNNGRIYTVEEAQGVLPEHPNCEGTWVAAGV